MKTNQLVIPWVVLALASACGQNRAGTSQVASGDYRHDSLAGRLRQMPTKPGSGDKQADEFADLDFGGIVPKFQGDLGRHDELVACPEAPKDERDYREIFRTERERILAPPIQAPPGDAAANLRNGGNLTTAPIVTEIEDHDPCQGRNSPKQCMVLLDKATSSAKQMMYGVTNTLAQAEAAMTRFESNILGTTLTHRCQRDLRTDEPIDERCTAEAEDPTTPDISMSALDRLLKPGQKISEFPDTTLGDLSRDFRHLARIKPLDGLTNASESEIKKRQEMTTKLLAVIDRAKAQGQNYTEALATLKVVNPSAAEAISCLESNSQAFSKGQLGGTGIGPLSGIRWGQRDPSREIAPAVAVAIIEYGPIVLQAVSVAVAAWGIHTASEANDNNLAIARAAHAKDILINCRAGGGDCSAEQKEYDDVKLSTDDSTSNESDDSRPKPHRQPNTVTTAPEATNGSDSNATTGSDSNATTASDTSDDSANSKPPKEAGTYFDPTFDTAITAEGDEDFADFRHSIRVANDADHDYLSHQDCNQGLLNRDNITVTPEAATEVVAEMSEEVIRFLEKDQLATNPGTKGYQDYRQNKPQLQDIQACQNRTYDGTAHQPTGTEF